MSLALGGDCLADSALLRAEPGVFGRVASDPTVSRLIDAVAGDADAALAAIESARAAARARVWALAGDHAPDYDTDGSSPLIIDVDATLVTAHSEKEHAAANFKGGFGFHPLGAWCDNTGEMLAVRLRPGNANANHAGDHIAVLGEAIGQIPAAYRRRLLVRADTAGATHQLLDWLTEQDQVRGRSVEYSIGFPVHKGIAVHDAIHQVPETAWQTALDTDGEPRDSAGVVEITGLLDLAKWPAGMRVIVRREKPHPGAGLTLFEQADGWRYQAFATNTTTRAARLPGSPAPGPRPGRGPDPGRERHRSRPAPVAGVRHQPGVGPDRRDRRRPDLLAPTPRPARPARPRQGRAETAAVPDAARPRPPRPAAADDADSASPPPGPGPPPSPPRSPGSPPSPPPPDADDHRPPRPGTSENRHRSATRRPTTPPSPTATPTQPRSTNRSDAILMKDREMSPRTWCTT